MAKHIIKELFRMIFLLIAVSIITFTMTELSPIDTVDAYIGENSVSSEQRERIAEYWGLNEPPVSRFFKWAGNILHGDMGTSMIYRRPVKDVIGERFRISLWLMLVSWIMCGITGLVLGIIAALCKGNIIDKGIKIYCLALESSPAFWIGMILLLIFSVWLGWLPLGLASPIGTSVEDATFGEKVRHIILPAAALSLTGISKITMQIREKMIQALESDYALFAFSRGESRSKFTVRHGIRNILLPFITLQFGSLSELFGGSVLAETVFTYPGLGNVTVQSALKGDIPLFLGIALFSSLFVFVGNLTANILYSAADPRIREGAEA